MQHYRNSPTTAAAAKLALMSRVLVLGASGMLGHKLCQELPKRGHEVDGTLRRPAPQLRELLGGVELIEGVDALEPGSIESTIASDGYDFVINTIAVLKPTDQPEDDYAQMARAINAELPHMLARACSGSGSRLIHISTDAVFSGRKGNYAEHDPSDVDDVYGKSKYLGELGEGEPAALTVRSSIIGREVRKRSHGLVEWFLSQRGSAITGFSRAIYSGFSTIEMARIIDLVMQRTPDLSGVHHVASAPISKFDLLELIKYAFGIDVEIVRDDEFVCDRSLRMGLFADRTGYVPPAWRKMIEQMFLDPTPYDEIRAAAGRRP